MNPIVSLHDATMRYGDRVLFEHLDLDIAPGEFLTVLGPNGSGKTTLLHVVLGLTRLTSGRVTINGLPATRGNRTIGYVPQQRTFDPELPIRGRDLVALGVDGHRFGIPFPRRATRRIVDDAIDGVGGAAFADTPIGLLSGGEQQRLRIAHALASDPAVLLCDEPLLSLDVTQQGVVSALIDERRRRTHTAVVFVTHEINPVLDYVDRVLYLADGRWAVGRPDEVLTTNVLRSLYDSDVEVLNVHGRIIVVGAGEHAHH